MPGFGTTERTRGNAAPADARRSAPRCREIPITALSEAVFAAIGHPPEREDVTFENVQAWLRKLLLFATASQERGIDLGTGDLSEMALGWCTYGGDHMSHYGVNAGVPKTLITYLIAWAAEVIFAERRRRCRRCCATCSTRRSAPSCCGPAPTARSCSAPRTSSARTSCTTSSSTTCCASAAARAASRASALHAFDGRYPLAEIRRWLLVFLRRFFANQFKRDCMPDGPKVGSGGSLSPRGDWRMPSDASPALWLAEAEAIPSGGKRVVESVKKSATR